MVLEVEFIPCLIETTSEERGVSEIATLSLFLFSCKNSGRKKPSRVHPSSF